MIAAQTGYTPDELYYTFGDAHIYLNHIDQVRTQLERTPYKLPIVEVKPRATIDDYRAEDFIVSNYVFHPAIKAPVAV